MPTRLRGFGFPVTEARVHDASAMRNTRSVLLSGDTPIQGEKQGWLGEAHRLGGADHRCEMLLGGHRTGPSARQVRRIKGNAPKYGGEKAKRKKP